MSTYAMIFQAIGIELKAYGEIRAGQIAQSIHESNRLAIQENTQRQVEALGIAATFDRRNATIAEQEAVLVKQMAAYNERRQRTAGEYQQGGAVAVAGASGVTMEGSALEVLANNAYEHELDALAIRYSGELQARALKDQAKLLNYQATLRAIEAQAVQRQGAYNMALQRFAGSNAYSSALIGMFANYAAGLGQMAGANTGGKGLSAGTGAGMGAV